MARRITLLAMLAGIALTACREPPTAETAPPRPQRVEIDRVSARLEKSDSSERLIVSLTVRAAGPSPLNCFLFVVARADRAIPRLWAIWPTENPGLAISAGGHFHAAHPASGHSLELDDGWQRVDAVLPRTPGQPPFDFAVAYIVGPSGTVLLAHPFPI
jgi:hypothetical protein